MMKKVISFITALSIIGTMSFATYAYDEPVQPVAPASSYGVMPLYDNVNYVASGIDINESNKAICTGSYFLYSTKKSVITMTLMKSTDGVSNEPIPNSV